MDRRGVPMRTPTPSELLQVWERGEAQPLPVRALLLLATASPERAGDELAQWNIGRRDRTLLDLRDTLFGPDVQCLAECTSCGTAIELAFRVDDIRVGCGEPGRTYHTTALGHEVSFRLVDSLDLLDLAGREPDAERHLLSRCVIDAHTADGPVPVSALPDAVVAAVGQGMSEADPQADVLLEVVCPACAVVSPAPFDIVSHLWAELDAWARRVVRDVHTLASAYGWRETDILAMSARRRRAYLDVIAG